MPSYSLPTPPILQANASIQLRPNDYGNIVQDPEYFTQIHRFRFHAGSYERNFSHRSIHSSYGFQSDLDPFIKYNGICARRHISGISYLYELRYLGHCAVWFSIFSCFFFLRQKINFYKSETASRENQVYIFIVKRKILNLRKLWAASDQTERKTYIYDTVQNNKWMVDRDLRVFWPISFPHPHHRRTLIHKRVILNA